MSDGRRPDSSTGLGPDPGLRGPGAEATIKVVLLGTFSRYLPRGERGPGVLLRMPGPAPLRAVRDRLGIPPETPRIVYRGGRPLEDDDLLFDGEEVSFVSPMAGG